MDRVVVTKTFIGAFRMAVCAVPDASDEEILAVCNRQNPSGTEFGWMRVHRDGQTESGTSLHPVQCQQEPERIHFIIGC